jgi:hypothetical protein
MYKNGQGVLIIEQLKLRKDLVTFHKLPTYPLSA